MKEMKSEFQGNTDRISVSLKVCMRRVQEESQYGGTIDTWR